MRVYSNFTEPPKVIQAEDLKRYALDLIRLYYSYNEMAKDRYHHIANGTGVYMVEQYDTDLKKQAAYMNQLKNILLQHQDTILLRAEKDSIRNKMIEIHGDSLLPAKITSKSAMIDKFKSLIAENYVLYVQKLAELAAGH